MNMIRKGQILGVEKGDIQAQIDLLCRAARAAKVELIDCLRAISPPARSSGQIFSHKKW